MSLISDAQVAQFHELGYFVTEVVLDPSQLAEATAEFDRLYVSNLAAIEKSGHAANIELARNRPFIGAAHKRSEPLRRLIQAPIYLEACAKFIGPDADLYFNQVVIKPPEKGRHFAWHQDSGYVETKPLAYITCWTAIGDTTLDNGCIWVVPRSHKLGLLPHPRDMVENMLVAQADESQAIPVPMKAGQVAIFSSLTLHKSGPNTSQTIRRGYVPQYHVPGVIGVRNNQLFGDQYPVLRGGQKVAYEYTG
jgi:phytanoyl-CoA hydroxylase